MAVLYVDHCTPLAAASSNRKMLRKARVVRLSSAAKSGLGSTRKGITVNTNERGRVIHVERGDLGPPASWEHLYLTSVTTP